RTFCLINARHHAESLLSVSALLNKSNFQEMDESDHCSRFRIGFLWQSKSLKSPTGQPHSGSAVR
ncbi:hypothetical protein FNA32_00005, partial [Salmonella enterica]|nr:hypothetical protein [Salmonella enterica]EBR7775463.1 hypothetical protein [Salmonella enterica]ECJ1121176.1 hypothetical protein [Salmonella enterica]ECJ9423000.1 hypothetical protein [Salmonella enterica]EDN2215875.1 hypothetical protein [Salmonella enterica]